MSKKIDNRNNWFMIFLIMIKMDFIAIRGSDHIIGHRNNHERIIQISRTVEIGRIPLIVGSAYIAYRFFGWAQGVCAKLRGMC